MFKKNVAKMHVQPGDRFYSQGRKFVAVGCKSGSVCNPACAASPTRHDSNYPIWCGDLPRCVMFGKYFKEVER